MKIKPYNNAPVCRVGLLKPKINVNIGLMLASFRARMLSRFALRVQVFFLNSLSHPWYKDRGPVYT